jgi:hypothetical protein
MGFSFYEIPNSRSFTQDPPSSTFTYQASGELDERIVWSYALGATPAYVFSDVGILYRGSVDIREKGHEQFEVTVPYTRKKNETGSFSWNFDTSGATVKIKVSREHIKSYPLLDDHGDEMPTDPHEGAMGVKDDGDVEGVEIIIPALKISAQFKHPQGVVTLAHAKNLARATGCTNLNPYLDGEFDGGELLFLGATGSDGTDTDAEVNYQFAASQNADKLSFGKIANIVKKGWHYAWVEFKPSVDEGQKAVVPKRVHIERVYNEIDFESVLGWGGDSASQQAG